MAQSGVTADDRTPTWPKEENARLNKARWPAFGLTSGEIAKVLARIVILAVPIYAFAAGLHRLQGGWDDGAITASFSRTFAEIGRFALTPVSAEVEGFSSVSWVLLLAIAHYFFKSPEGILVWMKLLSAAAFLLSLLVFRRIALRLLATAEQANLATVLMALIVPPMIETLNGMEMNLYMLLILCLVHVLTDDKLRKHHTLGIWVLTPALIVTRFESPYLIGFLILGLLASRDWWPAFHLTVSTGAAFGLTELWRFFRFHTWMPNTVYAKMLPPYSPPLMLYPMASTRVEAVLEIIKVLGGPLLVVLLVTIGSRLRKRTDAPPRWAARHRFVLSILFCGVVLFLTLEVLPGFLFQIPRFGENLFILPAAVMLTLALALKSLAPKEMSSIERAVLVLTAAGVAFGIIFGKNLGYDGRMVIPCIPFLVLALVLFLERRTTSEYWSRIALGTCIVLQIFAWGSAARAAWRQDNPVPISGVEKNGLAVDAVRRLLKQDKLSVLIPDVGGSSLCCERLDILDFGLLTNSYLAHHGYRAFDEYLRQQNPQVIYAYGYWAFESKIYRTQVLADYSLVMLEHTRLLVRNDVYTNLYRELGTSTGAHIGFGTQCLGNVQGDNYGWVDKEFLKSRPSCLVVSHEDLVRNGLALR
jgi:hypothetical protein